MTKQEIKQAIDNGQSVHWANESYEVIKANNGEYLIHCSINGHCIGLHGKEGTQYENELNGKESDFYIKN